jgi:acetyl-CoA C-acetyltransferase
VIGAWLIEMDEDPDTLWERTNVSGGAIALGHPLGCTGAKLLTTLVHEMQRSEARYGLQSLCEGGGMANATILERIPA